jgi:hypothetical protein
LAVYKPLSGGSKILARNADQVPINIILIRH